jgi:hypothetical protein
MVRSKRRVWKDKIISTDGPDEEMKAYLLKRQSENILPPFNAARGGLV